ncbi:MAG: hypothetical protein RSE12_16910 [Fuscovulum sp.]|nr:MAG: hypothetical protein RSE12_16910 [Fuscovulum sp.]
MKIIPPFMVKPANLVSNVPITETLWTPGTYAFGVQRYVGTTIYEVVAIGGTSDEPVAGSMATPPTWIAVGSINRFKMFDFVIGDATMRAGPIDVTITPMQVVNAVALFQVQGNTVQVVMTDPVDGIVYDETKSLVDNTGISDWYQYFFAPVEKATEVAFFDLPSYGTANVRIVIDAGTEPTACGELIIGRSVTIGTTLQSFDFGIEDFSRKERDDFGNFIIVERRFAKLSNYDIFLENFQVNAAFRELSKIRATPAVYVGNEKFPETIALGFYRDFATLRTGPVTSEMTLEIEGLV